MLDASSRLLRLLPLLTARHAWSGPELAERLEVTPRTLRRDIDKLRTLGYPIRSTSGIEGGYQLGAGQSLPPLLLDEQEALAVAVGLRSAAASALSGAAESAVRALAKLEQVLPAKVRKKVRALDASVSLLPFSVPQVSLDELTRLADACRDRRVVSFGYTDQAGNPSTRLVEPHGLVPAGSRWYLVGWDQNREDFRSFRVDRLAQVQAERSCFVPRAIPRGSAANYVSHSVGVSRYEVTAKVLLHVPLEDMKKRVSPFAGKLSAAPGNRCYWETGAATWSHIASHLCFLGCDFEVVDAPELKKELLRISRRLARASKSSA